MTAYKDLLIVIIFVSFVLITYQLRLKGVLNFSVVVPLIFPKKLLDLALNTASFLKTKI